MSKTKWIISPVFALLLSLSLLATSCAAPTGGVKPEDFYKGSTIDMIVPSAAGGTTDLLGRLWSDYLKAELQATAVPVSNLRAAGGVEGYMRIWSGAPDGLSIGPGMKTTVAGNEIMAAPGVSYKADQYSYIYSLGREYFYCAVGAKFKTVADLKAGKGMKFAASSPGGPTVLSAATVIDILGLDAVVVPGFPGMPEVYLSVQQGESVAGCGPLSTILRGVQAGQIFPLCVLAAKRDPVLPNVPTLGELVPLTGANKDLVEKIWGEMFIQSYMLMGSPGIPKDRLEYLRTTADRIAGRTDFRTKVNSAKGYEETVYITGAELEKQMKEMMAAREQIRTTFEALQKKYAK